MENNNIENNNNDTTKINENKLKKRTNKRSHLLSSSLSSTSASTSTTRFSQPIPEDSSSSSSNLPSIPITPTNDLDEIKDATKKMEADAQDYVDNLKESTQDLTETELYNIFIDANKHKILPPISLAQFIASSLKNDVTGNNNQINSNNVDVLTIGSLKASVGFCLGLLIGLITGLVFVFKFYFILILILIFMFVIVFMPKASDNVLHGVGCIMYKGYQRLRTATDNNLRKKIEKDVD